MPNSFRMYRKPGPPGEYYGYIEIDGVQYRLKAQSVPDRRPNVHPKQKCYVGTVERNLKADQADLFPKKPPARRYRTVEELTGEAMAKPQRGCLDDIPADPRTANCHVPGCIYKGTPHAVCMVIDGQAGSNPAAVLTEQRDAAGSGTGGLKVPPSVSVDPDFDDDLPPF